MKKKKVVGMSGLYYFMMNPVMANCKKCGRRIRTLGETEFHADTVCVDCMEKEPNFMELQNE